MHQRTGSLGIALLITLLATSTVLASSSAHYDLAPSVISPGGGTSAGRTWRVRGIVVAGPAAEAASESFRLRPGAWGVLRGGDGAPRTPREGTYLPLVQRGH